MAWTMKVAVLCVVVSTIVANKKYKSPLQVFKEPKDIESIFENGKLYYVTAGTVKQGPEQHPRYNLYCGKVTVERNATATIMKRRNLIFSKGRWTWLHAYYNVSIRTNSTGKKHRKYAEITSMHGMHTLVANLYLLWLETTCAFFYNSHTGFSEILQKLMRHATK
uniref:Putative salivary lipocalin n=1 Tax=Ixodes ricinus TaxID=34613 RepID=A0A6B0UXR9_IXORI